LDPTGHAAESLGEAGERALAARNKKAGKPAPAVGNTGNNEGCGWRCENGLPQGTTLDELTPDQKAQLAKDAAQVREDQAWRERYGAVVGEDKREGLLARAARAIDQTEEAAINHVGEQANALAKQRLAPKDSEARRNAAIAREQTYGTPEAERLAANDTAQGFQQFGEDVGEAGGRGATRLAIEYAKAELGARALQGAAGVVGAGAGKLGAAVRSSRALGAEGEALVVRQLEAKGYSEIKAIQNNSGHGIDIVARNKSGELRFFEVKTTTTGSAGRYSEAQRYTEDFITTRLERASQAQGQWQNLDQASRRRAAGVLAEIRGGAPVQGIKVDVMYPAPGVQGPPQMTFSRWREP